MTDRFVPTLEHLLAPHTPEHFFREHWERRPLWINRDAPDHWASLLTVDDIDHVLTTLQLHQPEDVSLVSNARRITADEYSYASGLLDVVRAYKLFADGATIVLPNLEARLAQLARLCRTLEARLATRFQTNIYFTPANAQGFKPHYDTHDVFVLQLHGSKHWILYDTPIELPFRRQDFDPAVVKPGPVSAEFTLRAGDLLYVPRGVMHDARTTGDASLHITLGVLATSWTDLIAEALAQTGLRDVAFRHALPLGFTQPGFDREAARAKFRALLHKLADEADFDAVLEHFTDDLVSTRHPLVPGQLAQLARLQELTADSEASARPGLVFTLRGDDAQVYLACYGASLRFPAHVAASLEFALRNARYRVRDIPGLDEAGQLVLAHRLVREGLIELHAG